MYQHTRCLIRHRSVTHAAGTPRAILYDPLVVVDIPPVNELNETEYHKGAARVVFSFIQRVDQWDI